MMQSNNNVNQAAGTFHDDERNSDEPSTSDSASVEDRSQRADKEVRTDIGMRQTEQKSNQPLRRARTRVRESWTALIRALSLSLIVPVFRGIRYPTGRGFHEPTKVAIRHSRLIALSRNLVHLVPLGFAIFEIILNWNSYYVGVVAYNTAVYQVIAKVHEIMIQASVATFMFSAVRRELAYGKGLPFGLLFSGLQVSQVSYLWSMELWGGMRAGFLRPSRKAVLLVSLTISIVLGVTSGPASAVLLIPRLQSWPAGRTHIWVNATADQIWPTHVDGTTVPQTCSILGTELSNECPASEWYAIRDWLILSDHTPIQPYMGIFRLADKLATCPVHGQNSARDLHWANYGERSPARPLPKVATTQQAVIADALTNTGSLWQLSLVNVTADTSHGSPLSDHSGGTHAIFKNYSQPYSAAACAHAEIHNDSDSRHVAFPLLLPFYHSPAAAAMNKTEDKPLVGPDPRNHGRNGTLITGSVEAIEHPNYLYYQILDAPGDVQNYRLKWIELPGDIFNGSSIGAAILLPKLDPSSTHAVVLCNIAAGWGPSSLAFDSTSGALKTMASTFHRPQDKGYLGLPIGESYTPAAEGEDPILGQVFTEARSSLQTINISESWAQYLDPWIEDFNTSLTNVLMEQLPMIEPDAVRISSFLPMLMVNGLARTGWGSNLQGEVRSIGPNVQGGLDGNSWLKGKNDVFIVDRKESQNWVTLSVESSLRGYAYNTLTVPPRIAIAILTVYCVLVVGHVFYSGITGISSNCWDTIAEVTALAVNSTPTAALRNTCAGITELHIFKLPVRILVSKDEEGEGEHLELVFGQVDDDDDDDKIMERTIKANRAYGILPRGMTGEGKKDV